MHLYLTNDQIRLLNEILEIELHHLMVQINRSDSIQFKRSLRWRELVLTSLRDEVLRAMEEGALEKPVVEVSVDGSAAAC